MRTFLLLNVMIFFYKCNSLDNKTSIFLSKISGKNVTVEYYENTTSSPFTFNRANFSNASATEMSYIFTTDDLVKYTIRDLSSKSNNELFKKEDTVLLGMKCNSSHDCSDLRMVCSRSHKCKCSLFHDWELLSKRCIPNMTKIHLWLQATMSTNEGVVSQQEDFTIKQLEPYTILVPNWAEYGTSKEAGVDHIPRILWPIIFGFAAIILIYGAILLDCL